jgi:hypothetical protein
MKDLKFELTRLTNYSDEEIIREIQRVAKKLSVSPLTISVFEKESKVKIQTVRRRFCGWKEALEIAGLGHLYSGQTVTENMKTQSAKGITDDELLDELKRVSSLLGRKALSLREFLDHSKIVKDQTIIFRRFGSWKKATRLAGLDYRFSGSERKHSNEDLFENLYEVWIHYGRQPHYSEMNNEPSKIKSKNYTNRFGTWRKALLAFIEYTKKDFPSEEKQVEEKFSVRNTETPKMVQQEILKRDTEDSRSIPLGLRFKVMYRDDFKCVLCGNNPPTSPGLVLHVDHIVPWSKGGKTQIDNLRTLCAACNIGRGNRYVD